MTIFLKIIAFLLGLTVSVQLVAALFGIFDLRYALSRTWPRLVRGILIWSAVTILLAWIIGSGYRLFFLLGVVLYLPFYYVCVYLGGKLFFRRNLNLLDREK